MRPITARAAWAAAACVALLALAGPAARAAEGDAAATAAPAFRPGAEPHAFQAEVARLMDILVHSLYSNRDVFLRELISNAADALDKRRFLAVSRGDAEPPLEIRISVDREKKVLSVRDTGVGMNRSELVANLGTIARSGTAAFLDAAQRGGDLSLIGQFGVGFYSVYLVGDYVEVTTAPAEGPDAGKQHVWESAAAGGFAVSPDAGADLGGAGTRVDIHLKPDAAEFADEARLRALVARYSEFVNFPIYLEVEKTVEREVPVEDDEAGGEGEGKEGAAAGAAGAAGKADVAVEDEDDDAAAAAKKPKARTVAETTREWELLNAAKALWLRPPGEVSDAEHASFFKALTRQEYEAPLAHAHFRAEGDVDFKAVLYVPASAPPDLMDAYHTRKPSLRLYVRRVFVSDSFEDLLPRWLSWLVGLVDSDSMPLNVSRESLQLGEALKVVRKKLARKALDLLRRLSDAEAAWRDAEDAAAAGGGGKKGFLGLGGSSAAAEAAKLAPEGAKYTKAWAAFGKALKMGIVEDATARKRLMPLLRFASSATAPGGNLTRLDAYVARMRPGQKHIYFLVGSSVEELAASPFVEALAARGLEVIYFTDPLDEYVMQNLSEYEGHEFANASREGLKLGDEDGDGAKERRRREKADKEKFKGLAKWWRDALGADAGISAVRVSRRLAASPCAVVAGRWGWTATMERVARSQALGDAERARAMRGQRALEINPRHPLVAELRARVDDDPEAPGLADRARLLFETCLLESGFLLDDTRAHAARVLELVRADLGVASLAPLPEEALPAEDEGAAGADGGDDDAGERRGSGVEAFEDEDGGGGLDINMDMDELMAKAQAGGFGGGGDVKDEL